MFTKTLAPSTHQQQWSQQAGNKYGSLSRIRLFFRSIDHVRDAFESGGEERKPYN